MSYPWRGRAALLLALGSLLGTGCARESEAPTTRPSVFIYLVDTLRPDHLGLYGYERGTSPRLDAFGRDAVVFENAYTTSAWTRPAAASLLTGLLPPDHRAVTKSARIPSEVKLVGEYLRPLGYESAAFSGNFMVLEEWGFDQGFDHFADLTQEATKPRGEEVVDRALEHLETMGDGPVLVYVHTVDPHGPYRPSPPFDARFGAAGTGKVLLPRNIDRTVAEDDLRATVDAYDGEIAYTDQQFGRFLDYLRSSGRYEDSLVVFVSDHGEEFLEHGEGGHARTLYEELVRVPMIVKFPNRMHAGQRIRERVSLVDVLPTILAANDVARPQGLAGVDLAGVPDGDVAALDRRPLFFDLDVYRSDGSIRVLDGVLQGPWKLIRYTYPEVSTELFDLSRDPSESRDRAGELGEEVERLGRLIQGTRPAGPSGVVMLFLGAAKRDARVFEGEARTEGTFVGLQLGELEEEDAVWLDPSGQVLRWRVVCRERNRADVDELSFRLFPPDASFEIESLRDEGGAAAHLYLGQERVRAQEPRSFREDSPELRIDRVAFARWKAAARERPPPAGGYLFSVPALDLEEEEIDEETLERLRALGYVR